MGKEIGELYYDAVIPVQDGKRIFCKKHYPVLQLPWPYRKIIYDNAHGRKLLPTPSLNK